MKNLLNSTNIATVFLDNDLNIKRFTTEAKSIINLISSDIGRPVSDIASKLKYDTLSEDCNQVLKTLVFKEIEVQTKDDQWYQLRILPYRTSDNKIDGLVVTFININELKNTEEQLEDYVELKNIIDSFPSMVCYIDSNERYQLVNKSYESWFGISRDEIKGKTIKQLVGSTVYKKMKNYVKDSLEGKLTSVETELISKEGNKVNVLMKSYPNLGNDGKVLGFICIKENIK
jgi:two-component system, chemotaxis family, CheB/CheR fusion protein